MLKEPFDDFLKQNSSRRMEIFVGIVLSIISVIFLSLTVIFIQIAFENDAPKWSLIFFIIFLAFVGISLGSWALRLIRNRGIKGGSALISTTAIKAWSLFFGVSGFALIPFSIFRDQPAFMISAIWCIVMALGAAKLAKNRAQRETSL